MMTQESIFPKQEEQISKEQTQIRLTVDGCPVKLNFAPKSEKAAIEDIKRMILTGMPKVQN
jgi:hypothetical protein